MLNEVFNLESLLEDRASENLRIGSDRQMHKFVSTSFCIVSETRSRLEWGSVQIKWASVKRTLFSPLSFLRQIASSSEDSGRAKTHELGGDKNLSQFLQNETEAEMVRDLDWLMRHIPCLGIPSVISTLQIS